MQASLSELTLVQAFSEGIKERSLFEPVLVVSSQSAIFFISSVSSSKRSRTEAASIRRRLQM